MTERRGNKPRVTHNTPFANWRREVNLSISEAAHALGKARHTIICMDRGSDYIGRPYVPQRDTLILMRAIAEGYEPREWQTAA